MGGRSALAETLADYAISVAKRNDNEKAEELHLLAAVRRWQPETFDTRFPGLGDALAASLAAQRGSSVGSATVGENIDALLDRVRNADDVWAIAGELTATLAETLAVAVTPASPGGGDGPRSSADDILPCAITVSLLERVSALTGEPLAAVAERILADAYVAAARVLQHPPDDLADTLTSLVGVEGAACQPSKQFSTLVRDVSLRDAPAGPRAATQLASALVDIAEWAAVMDDTVTEEETDQIDSIRLELRAQLENRLDAESPEMAEFERRFSMLVGMESVKAELRRRVDFLVVTKRRERRGAEPARHRMHVAFVGNPGTGKTTVARLYGELLNNLGLLPTKNFIETDRSGLVAGFVGQTEEKTMDAIGKADGGVLFIDEAYALNDNYGSQKGFGEEATDVLVKQMEDRRDRLVVILAGYKEPTLNFITMNPGLKSRVPLIVDFPDYSDDELIEIAHRLASQRELVLTDGALECIREVLSAERATEGFGNARSVENLLEAAQRNVISRMAALGNLATDDELSTVLAEDIPAVPQQREKRRIGFLRED